jgi:hypothetical protein
MTQYEHEGTYQPATGDVLEDATEQYYYIAGGLDVMVDEELMAPEAAAVQKGDAERVLHEIYNEVMNAGDE